jgi:hypothetical protein
MSSSELPPRRFFGIFFGLITLFVVTVLSLTWLIDPTGFLRHTYGGEKACDAKVVNPALLFSPSINSTMDWPETIWLGSSRVGFGFSAHGRANLGLPSASMADISRIGMNAIRSGQVRDIRIGLELGQFSNPSKVVARDLGDDWFTRNYPALRRGLFDDRAIVSALRGCEQSQVISPNQAVSHTMDPAKAESALSFTLNGVTRISASERDTFYQAAFANLEQMVAEARAKRVRVTFWIGPNRSSYWPALSRAGLLPFHVQWKSDLASLAQRSGASLLDVDESYIPALSCPGSTNRDCHFVDATHYSPYFGAEIDKLIDYLH